MALIQCNFFSEILGLCSTMNVIIPQKTSSRQIGVKSSQQTREKYPVLYLLHGLSDDHSIWLRRTSVERYASEYPLIIVMPAAGRSFYTDMESGPRYWTFISEELPQIVEQFFPISTRPEETFVAGLSMGGYGAFKLALRNPERFAAAGSFSGALTLESLKKDKQFKKEKLGIFGKKIKPEDDLLKLAERLKKDGKKIPRLYQSCGTEDFLYKENLKFKAHAKKLGFDLTYVERQGTHEWGFWDTEIQHFLKWLNIK